ncbi:MAG TPA: DUF3300 domain-containing protein [Bryobacteraceae bacterium]
MKLQRAVPAVSVMLAALAVAPAFGQAPPPTLPPPQLDNLVARIALYPDPLIAQILAAATYPDQVQPAAMWADQHHYLTGAALASAIQADQLPWDPSVQALLPFPSVLEMMSSDMNWTTQIGNAFLVQQPDVMDAIQRERVKARDFGYLRSNAQIVVGGGPYITIMPANPAFMVVPYYDPGIVFLAPRPGFAVGGAISFGYGITIGAFFRPWGWGPGLGRFDWGSHAVFINNHPWGRTWGNRVTYVHPYEAVRRPAPGAARPVEGHQLEQRSPEERKAAQTGKRLPPERHKGKG